MLKTDLWHKKRKLWTHYHLLSAIMSLGPASLCYVGEKVIDYILSQGSTRSGMSPEEVVRGTLGSVTTDKEHCVPLSLNQERTENTRRGMWR